MSKAMSNKGILSRQINFVADHGVHSLIVVSGLEKGLVVRQ